MRTACTQSLACACVGPCSAGHFTFWGGFMLDVAAIEGWYGLGIFFYVGGGSLLLGGTGFLHEHAIKTPDIDIWVTVRNCEICAFCT